MFEKLIFGFISALILNTMTVDALSSRNLANMKISPENFKRINSTMTKFQGGDDFPWDTFCVDFNVPDSTFFPHPLDCEWYFVCWEDELLIGECDDGTIFNPNIGTCDSPNNYECVLGLFPEWNYQDCPPPGSGQLVLLPSLFCDAFYICIDGQPIEMQCRPGHHWNAERLFCDDPRNAGCENGNGNTPNVLPDCPATFRGNVPHPDDCNLFIHCANGNRFIQRCPHLFQFDVVTATCLVITQANCIDEYRGRRRN